MGAPAFHAEDRRLRDGQVDRRTFVKVVTTAAAAVGLSSTAAARIVEAASKGLKPSVIWLHFQECTGCTESLLRTTHPGLADLILDLISLDYHETLLAAAGHQAEDVLKKTMTEQAGKYVLIVEGAIPTKDGGIYCQIGGRTAMDILKEAGEKAGAIIAIGSCASWGGIPSADPNPTGATGAPTILQGKTVVTLPGCPANPYILLGTVLQYVALGTLPALDDKGRPKFAYGRTIHEHCPRRAHFDAGRFVETFGDANHREGYCLYKMGCKGRPPTPAARPCTSARWSTPGRSGSAPLLRLHRAEAGLPRAAARHGRDRAAHPARHLPAHPRRARTRDALGHGPGGPGRRRAAGRRLALREEDGGRAQAAGRPDEEKEVR